MTTNRKREFAAVSNLIDFTQFHLICQILAKFSGVEFETTVSKFRKIKIKFLHCLQLYCIKRGHETRKFHVAGRDKTAKKCKKIDPRFANLNLLFFSPSRYRSRRRCLSSIIVIQTFCYHGNLTSHFSSLRWLHTCDACVISTWRLRSRAPLVARNNSNIIKGLKTSSVN